MAWIKEIFKPMQYHVSLGDFNITFEKVNSIDIYIKKRFGPFPSKPGPHKPRAGYMNIITCLHETGLIWPEHNWPAISLTHQAIL